MSSSLDYPISAIQEPLRVSGKFFREGSETIFLKTVTFGPFPAGAFPDEGRSELGRIRGELGANAIRVYEIPSLEFMHDCAAAGLRVFITIPWAHHVDFLQDRQILAEADRLLLETVETFRGHPALAGYFVGNEIETTLVRWMGPKRVLEQLERLIDLGHSNDPDALFAYANYPSTEYLLPCNQDFVAFNLYLETRESLQKYLDRLQNLAGDKPLVISEFGIDAKAHGEDEQAKMLDWHVSETCAAGVAGTTIFAWSDLWRRGGEDIEGWDFGLTRRDGSPKPAFYKVSKVWKECDRPAQDLVSPENPLVTVIVCTYKGSGSLVECLDSLVAMAYPNYEVLIVNDGSDERVSELAGEYASIRLINVEHMGLSAARNVGAQEAKGEILAYTDDDCIVEEDWLTWIVTMFASDENLGCVGGPNIPPPPETAAQARIAAAPGGPTHVLLDDTRAEHLPGCNLSVRRIVFEELGGFNPIFRTAGDDVDFCWRVLLAGYELGFSGPAFVWHHRRFSLPLYLKQQRGYGKAEAMLLPVHRDRFRGLGGAVWNGQVYPRHALGGSTVYHGRYGYEPFQLVYPSAESGVAEVFLHVIWWIVMLGLGAAAVVFPPLLIPAGVMLLLSIHLAWKRAAAAEIDRRFDTLGSRISLIGLVLLQGIVRSGSRIWYGWRDAKWTQSLGFLGLITVRKIASGWWKLGDERNFWSDKGVGRDELLATLLAAFPEAKDDVSGRSDIILKRGFFWNFAVLTASEYHEGGGRLTRLRLLARPRLVTRMIVLPLLLLTPIAVFLGFGFKSELLTLGLVYLVGLIASRLFLILFRPRFDRLARTAGLEPV